MLERDGGNGTGRNSGQLRSDRIERAGTTNVPGNVGDTNDPVDSRSGAHHAGDTVHYNLRDPGHPALGGHGNGEGRIPEARGSQEIVVHSVAGTASSHSHR